MDDSWGSVGGIHLRCLAENITAVAPPQTSDWRSLSFALLGQRERDELAEEEGQHVAVG